jgi:hypothetical protein
LKFFHSPINDINFSEIFSREKIFIKSPYHQQTPKKKKKKTIHVLQTPPPPPPKEKFLEKKSHLLALQNNQSSPSHATQETTFWVSPHPPKNSPIPIP